MSTPDHRPVGQEIQQNIKINRLEQCRLHPLIHTRPFFNLPQHIVSCQRLPLYGILLLPSDNLGEREIRK